MLPEIVVIGGGVIGSSITYHLARDGVKVMQLEKGSIANQGAASRASAGGVRLNNRDVREFPLAKASITRWKSLEEELDADLEYSPTGQIMLYDHSTSLEELKNQEKKNDAHKIQYEIVNHNRLQHLIPGLSSEFLSGIYYPSGGHANVLLTTVAFSEAARRLGATFKKGVEVYSIIKKSGKVTGVQTSEGNIHCGLVINAAGAWAPALHNTLSLSLPIKPYCHQMSATFAAPPILKGPVISVHGQRISLKQTIDGRIRAGGGYAAKKGPDRYTGIFNEESLFRQRKTAESIIPSMKDYQVDFVYHGVEGHCVDDIPILGAMPNVSGYLLAAGFSGHGFTLSPAVGQVLAEMAQSKTPSISIKGLTVDRHFDHVPSIKKHIHNSPG
ncbi:FAD-binding oxidoreductase [Alteribacillus sp. YIM 98480]|uniref:NAD(P)/FAD-dependent oxidoreductase n=1 Tax=Alteribacillus sp. YIM 98480 TaxID=2606599 RepID=UPI00131B91BF|nr:FAD-binding oxidoreductase [Alteribacillus sp. YIM 98480]